MPTPITWPTRRLLSRAADAEIPYVLQIHCPHQRDVARQHRNGPPASRLGAVGNTRRQTGPATGTRVAAEAGLNSGRRAVGDHSERPGRGQSGFGAFAGIVAPARPRRIRLDGHALHCIPCDRLGRRDRGRSKDDQPVRDRRWRRDPTRARPSHPATLRWRGPAGECPGVPSKGMWARARSAGVSSGKGTPCSASPLTRAGTSVAAPQKVGRDDRMPRGVESPLTAD